MLVIELHGSAVRIAPVRDATALRRLVLTISSGSPHSLLTSSTVIPMRGSSTPDWVADVTLISPMFDFVVLAPASGGESPLVGGELDATEPIESMLQGKFW